MRVLLALVAISLCASETLAGPLRRYTNSTSTQISPSRSHLASLQVNAAHEASSHPSASTTLQSISSTLPLRDVGSASSSSGCESMSSSYSNTQSVQTSTRQRGFAQHISPSSNAGSGPSLITISTISPSSTPTAHQNGTASRPVGAFGGRQPAVKQSSRSTTTLTLYTTVPPHAPASSSIPASGHSALSDSSIAPSERAGSSMHASSSGASEFSTASSADTTKRKGQKPTKPTSKHRPAFAYPWPKRPEHGSTASVTVDPVQPSYTASTLTYSYNPQPDQTSRGLPPIVTQHHPSKGTSDATPTSSPSTTSSTIAGITIVPVNPDATTIYMTVTTTTTDAGQTTTVAKQTVTAYI